MMLRRADRRRAGAVAVESAIVYPVVFAIVLAIVLLGVGVFRYQQVAHAAREGARWASVRGAQYAKERNTTAATPAEVYENAISPQMAGAPAAGLTYSVTWRTDAAGNPDKRPTRSVTWTNPTTGVQTTGSVSNFVTVTVSYAYDTLLFGTFTVSSTSVTPITF